MALVGPTFRFEEKIWQEGYERVAGIDEVGRGALAGPVVAAAVILPRSAPEEELWLKLKDSKLLSHETREILAPWIQSHAAGWAIGIAPAQLVDEVNVSVATRSAMMQAVQNLDPRPDYLLIDWVKLPLVNLPQESLAKADTQIVSVAAASIVAKVYRDRLMIELDKRYPLYGFGQNKGYGTPQHRAAIACSGPCSEHRHSFAPISKAHTLFDLDG